HIPNSWGGPHSQPLPHASLGTSPAAPSPLPSRWHWCEPGGCTPVKDQGACGSCWAFATFGPFESTILIRDGVVKDLSEQYLVS
ncbi:MAG: C1 family peptidase, partial [Anaerolineae bacterium]